MAGPEIRTLQKLVSGMLCFIVTVAVEWIGRAQHGC
jgi:hypothetical protein